MTVSAAVSTVPDRVPLTVFDGSRVRVVLMLDIRDGTQAEVLDAYERMCDRVAAVPGHISDQLCQSLENPTQWLITSEWESAPEFLAWANSEEHLEMVRPLEPYVRGTHSMRYSVLRETAEADAGPGAAARGALQPRPRIGDNLVRHAVTWTVKPDSVAEVAEILSGYTSPEVRVDDTTRLLRTSLFLHGNRIVRAIEVQGDLQAALRHVARQPEVRAVEEALNPHLEQDRDLTDPRSARLFFTLAALPAVHHVMSGRGAGGETERCALYYPARPGAGPALARLLARQGEATVGDPDSPVVACTVFHRDDLVVRLVDTAGAPERAPGAVLALHEPDALAEAGRLLDAAALGADGPPDDRALPKFLAHARMRPLTDRQAPAS
ncbi:SchA/CurD-like domain-containing protein [Streptomyces sp. NPDC052701]|uniref:SchA/CurD-like domain-containing protein n=1 Tax=Streptomyces sp. NPDC052701 TaxID=3155533 RepID=UPI003428491E